MSRRTDGSGAEAMPVSSEAPSAARERLAVCVLLDERRVKRGTKAMRTALGRHWTPGLEKEFGPAPNPSTVKRWLLGSGRSEPENGSFMP